MSTRICNPANSCAGGYGNCLDVKITNACNANCAFCIEKGGWCPESRPVRELAKETINSEAETVLILGGEPTLYPYLEEYLKLIRPWKAHIYMTTNGSMLRDGLTEKIAPYLDGINISIHHFSEMRNDEVYNKAGFHVSFEALRIAIKALHTAGVSVRINANLVKGLLETRDDVEAMIAFSRDYLKANEIRFSELQNCEDLWVDSRKIFPELPEDPFCAGCEQNLSQYKDIRVRIKMTCGRVNKLRPAVETNPARSGKTEVLYPNAIRSHGWVNPQISGGCHEIAAGCHSVSTLYSTGLIANSPSCHT